MMKLFEITNGWMGESYVRVYVIAESEAQALALAREKYKAEADRRDAKEMARAEEEADRENRRVQACIAKGIPPTKKAPPPALPEPKLVAERYYGNLSIVWSVDDLTKPYCSDISDG